MGTGDGGSPTIRTKTARTSTRCSASSCGSTRTRGMGGVHRAALQPVRRQAGRNEIYALGFRNPFRWSFDGPQAIVIADVGYNQLGGGRLREPAPAARARTSGGTTTRASPPSADEAAAQVPAKPIFNYPHTNGRCAIIGGTVVRDRALKTLRGRFVYADLCTGKLRSLSRTAWPRAITRWACPSPDLAGTVAAHGHVYVASLTASLPARAQSTSWRGARPAGQSLWRVESPSMEAKTASQADAAAPRRRRRPETAPRGAAGDLRGPQAHRRLPDRDRPVDSPARVPEAVARVRAAQPAWEAMGFAGRKHWLGKLRDWMIDNHDSRGPDAVRDGQGPRRRRARGASTSPTQSTSTPTTRSGSSATRPRAPTTRCSGSSGCGSLPAVPGGRQHQPLELPADPLLRRRDRRPHGRRRGGHQALRVHAADHDGDRRAWKEEVGGPDVLDFVNGIGETGGALVDAVDYVQFTGSDRTGRS